jgi:hypothetical protein
VNDTAQSRLMFDETKALIDAISRIADKCVKGQPNAEDPLDRLKELLKVLQGVKGDGTDNESSQGAIQDAFVKNVIRVGRSTQIQDFFGERMRTPVRGVVDQLREAAYLARSRCDLQREALVNKLSRAYQKPDFCIRRDAVGPDRDTLLRLELSWDEYWYHGKTDPEPS